MLLVAARRNELSVRFESKDCRFKTQDILYKIYMCKFNTFSKLNDNENDMISLSSSGRRFSDWGANEPHRYPVVNRHPLLVSVIMFGCFCLVLTLVHFIITKGECCMEFQLITSTN